MLVNSFSLKWVQLLCLLNCQIPSKYCGEVLEIPHPFDQELSFYGIRRLVNIHTRAYHLTHFTPSLILIYPSSMWVPTGVCSRHCMWAFCNKDCAFYHVCQKRGGGRTCMTSCWERGKEMRVVLRDTVSRLGGVATWTGKLMGLSV